MQILFYFSWTDPSGKSHIVRYIADEFGFRTFGDVGPTTSSSTSRQTIPPSENIASGKLNRKNLPNNFIVDQMLKNNGRNSGNDLPNQRININTKSETLGTANSVLESLELNAASLQRNPSSGGQLRGRLLLNIDSSARPRRFNQKPESQNPRNADGPKLAKMISGDIAGNIQDLFNLELPNPIQGTKFILIDRLQPPTMPKNRNSPTKITPVKVDVSEPVTVVVSGLHSSSRSKSLSTHHSNPFLRNSIENRTQHVPRPLKVEGNLNLENFFSPFVQTTPQPFQLDSLNDYYYYDYDYYDYLDSNSTSNTSATNSSTQIVSPSSIPINNALNNTPNLSKQTVQQSPPSSSQSSPSERQNPVSASVNSVSGATSSDPVQLTSSSNTEHNLATHLASVDKISFPSKQATATFQSPALKSLAKASSDANSESVEHGNSGEEDESDDDQSDENFEDELDD